MALEENSNSAWQRFHDLLSSQNLQFDNTKQQTQPPQDGSFQATQPIDALPGVMPPQQRQPQRAINIDEVMVLIRRNNRSCPRPNQWIAFHRLLPGKAHDGKTLEAPLPLIAGAWNATSPMQKRLRLRGQIEWAESTGALMAVYNYLLGLREEQWFHFDE